jgi:glucosamine 6-phosphate synthetase-like amidotransferase/phosphosugar isomerase protein
VPPLSQSREAVDTLACLRCARKRKQNIHFAVNVPTSTIARGLFDQALANMQEVAADSG